MSDKKGRRGPLPSVEVIRRPGAPVAPSVATAPPAPSAPIPSPLPRETSAHATAAPTPRSADKSAPTRAPLRSPPRRAGPPRPPPTPQQVSDLAKRERVPARIAKGELEGKMKARIWRKLHAEEAKRFDQVYELLAKTPGLSLPDAFGLLQSGMTLEAFQSRRARTQKKAAVKEARGTIPGGAVDAMLSALVEQKVELAVVLGERTALDVLTAVQPVAFQMERSGRLEKLQVVVLTRRNSWEVLASQVERDPKLAQKPQPVAREPEKRPFSDPRVFVPSVGQSIHLHLRNGIQLRAELSAVGPFDLLLKMGEHELFVPIHAILRWSAEPQEPSHE